MTTQQVGSDGPSVQPACNGYPTLPTCPTPATVVPVLLYTTTVVALPPQESQQKNSSSHFRQIVATVTTIALGIFVSIYGGLTHTVALVAVGLGIIGVGVVLLAPRIGFEGTDPFKKIYQFFKERKERRLPVQTTFEVPAPVYPYAGTVPEAQ